MKWDPAPWVPDGLPLLLSFLTAIIPFTDSQGLHLDKIRKLSPITHLHLEIPSYQCLNFLFPGLCMSKTVTSNWIKCFVSGCPSNFCDPKLLWPHLHEDMKKYILYQAQYTHKYNWKVLWNILILKENTFPGKFHEKIHLLMIHWNHLFYFTF